jgi:type I restriction enzyme S subunit
MKFDVVSDSIDHISREAIASSATSLIPKDAVLMVVRSGILARIVPIAITGRELTINQDLKALCPDETLDARFLYHLLDSRMEVLLAMVSRGATVHRLMTEQIRSLNFLLPPISEQQRIVGILDDAFDGIATAKANAEQNLQNARALFESHLQSVFTQRGEGWVEKRLEEVVATDCSLSYGIVQPGEEYPDGLPIVRPTDLTTQVIRLDGLKRIDPKLADGYKRTALQGGELLLCVRGSTGVVSIASAELAGGNVTRGIVPIRFDGAKLSQDFGYHLISSGEFQDQIRKKTYGAALMQINIRDLRNIAVSFPSLKEQSGISAKLDDLREETQRLESLYQRKLAALDELKKSLLHQAFSGAL